MRKVNISKDEALLIHFHLEFMREPVKKGYKHQHFFLWRKKINKYDKIINLFENDEKKEEITVSMTNEQVKTVLKFLEWYISELYKLPGSEKQHENINVLTRIKDKFN